MNGIDKNRSETIGIVCERKQSRREESEELGIFNRKKRSLHTNTTCRFRVRFHIDNGGLKVFERKTAPVCLQIAMRWDEKGVEERRRRNAKEWARSV
jgi:hypothetical protein